MISIFHDEQLLNDFADLSLKAILDIFVSIIYQKLFTHLLFWMKKL